MDFLCAQCGGSTSQIVTDIDGTLYTQCLKCGELTPIKNADELEEERRVIFGGRRVREGHAASVRPLASESPVDTGRPRAFSSALMKPRGWWK